MNNYGYVIGGLSYVGIVNNIDGIDFAYNNAITTLYNSIVVGNLNTNKFAISANHSSTHGYVYGGYSDSIISTIEKFRFSSNINNTIHTGNLSSNRNYTTANNSSTSGYIYGGYALGEYYFNYCSCIDKIIFSMDTGNLTIVNNLNIAKSNIASNNSTIYGYICGGNINAETAINSIDVINFSFDTGMINQRGSLNEQKSFISANNSSIKGYVCGGYQELNIYLDTIEEFQFSFDNVNTIQQEKLTIKRAGLTANNSSICGYICGGFTCNSIQYTYYSTIDRYLYSFDSVDTTIVKHIGNLTTEKGFLAANDTTFIMNIQY